MAPKSIYELYTSDAKREQDGIEVEFPGYGFFRLARAGGSNKRYQRALETKMRPYLRQMQMGVLQNEQAEKLLVEVFADTVILGWREVYGRDGQPLPFNRETCIKVLTDLPDLFEELRDQAAKIANFLQVEREEEAGNSSSS